ADQIARVSRDTLQVADVQHQRGRIARREIGDLARDDPSHQFFALGGKLLLVGHHDVAGLVDVAVLEGFHHLAEKLSDTHLDVGHFGLERAAVEASRVPASEIVDVLRIVANALDGDDYGDQHGIGRQVSRAAYGKVRLHLAPYVALEAVNVFVELVDIDFQRALVAPTP